MMPKMEHPMQAVALMLATKHAQASGMAPLEAVAWSVDNWRDFLDQATPEVQAEWRLEMGAISRHADAHRCLMNLLVGPPPADDAPPDDHRYYWFRVRKAERRLRRRR